MIRTSLCLVLAFGASACTVGPPDTKLAVYRECRDTSGSAFAKCQRGVVQGLARADVERLERCNQKVRARRERSTAHRGRSFFDKDCGMALLLAEE